MNEFVTEINGLIYHHPPLMEVISESSINTAECFELLNLTCQWVILGHLFPLPGSPL